MAANWDYLDASAEANLNQRDLAEWHRYKQRLRSDGIAQDDGDDILRGAIWGMIEDYE